MSEVSYVFENHMVLDYGLVHLEGGIVRKNHAGSCVVQFLCHQLAFFLRYVVQGVADVDAQNEQNCQVDVKVMKRAVYEPHQ